MNRFLIAQNAHCGVMVGFGSKNNNKFKIGGKAKLSNGIISNNMLCGINVQTKDIVLDDLSSSVLYFENNYNNLDTSCILFADSSDYRFLVLCVVYRR